MIFKQACKTRLMNFAELVNPLFFDDDFTEQFSSIIENNINKNKNFHFNIKLKIKLNISRTL